MGPGNSAPGSAKADKGPTGRLGDSMQGELVTLISNYEVSARHKLVGNFQFQFRYFRNIWFYIIFLKMSFGIGTLHQKVECYFETRLDLAALQPRFHPIQLLLSSPCFPLETFDLICYHTRPDIKPLLVKRRQRAPRGPRLGITRNVSEKLEEGTVIGGNRVVVFPTLELLHSLLFPLSLFSRRRQSLGSACQVSRDCYGLPLIDTEGEPSSEL